MTERHLTAFLKAKELCNQTITEESDLINILDNFTLDPNTKFPITNQSYFV